MRSLATIPRTSPTFCYHWPIISQIWIPRLPDFPEILVAVFNNMILMRLPLYPESFVTTATTVSRYCWNGHKVKQNWIYTVHRHKHACNVLPPPIRQCWPLLASSSARHQRTLRDHGYVSHDVLVYSPSFRRLLIPASHKGRAQAE